MKKNILKKIIFTLAFACSLTCTMKVQAATDDPGEGRLSRHHISEDFYDQTKPTVPLHRYGASSSLSPFTNDTYTHPDIFDGRTIVNGIDVSQWNGAIDWAQVKAAGIDFAFVRVGYRGYGDAGTLDASTKDSKFDINMQGAIANGINVGVYVFSQAITEAEAEEEANYILEAIGDYPISMPLIMDYEYADTSSGVGGRLKKANLSREAATNVCMAFCRRIAEAGYTPMVYANKSMLSDQLNASVLTDAGYRIWLANYTTATTYTGTYDFWQYSAKGKVPGIGEDVDMNFYYAKEDDNFTVTRTLIKDAVSSEIPMQEYTGVPITPAVTLTYNGVLLTPDVDYILRYQNNTNPGNAAVIVIGKGAYCGIKKIPFTISGMGSVSAKKRTTSYITLKWKKLSGVTGYQIYRSNALNGSYKKIATISKASTTTYKNKKLTSGKCYYYKIRSYTKKNGETTYSGFSPAVGITTKNSYTRYAFAKNGATLYSEAGFGETVISQPADETMLKVSYSTCDANGDPWYYVSYTDNGIPYTGFISGDEATITKYGRIVNTKKVNVRKSYSIKSKLLTTLKKKTKVYVISTKTKKGMTWYKVYYIKDEELKTGWISKAYVKLQ